MRKISSVVAAAGCAALLSSAPAFAAGGGYGGTGVTGTSVPAGFAAVSAVYSVNGTKGGTITKGSVHFAVPKGAKKGTFELVVYKGSTTTAKKDEAAGLKGAKVLATFGVGVFSGSSATTTGKAITVTYTAKTLKAGDKLAVYNPKTKKFSTVTAKFSKGKVTFTLKAGESVAIFS